MEFRLLGPLEVWEDGRPLSLGGTKQRALLGILLLRANEVVSRDVLVDELWGDRPPASAAHSVEAYVSRLRKTLHADRAGEPILVTRPPGYMLRAGFEDVDLHRYERLLEEGRRALGRQGLAYVEREYRWPTVIERVESLLDEVARRLTPVRP